MSKMQARQTTVVNSVTVPVEIRSIEVLLFLPEAILINSAESFAEQWMYGIRK